MAVLKGSVQIDRRKTPFLSREYNREFGNFSRDQAMKIAKRVRRRIREQRIRVKPLSPAWVAMKAKLGLDPRVLIANGAYVASIQARKVGKDRWAVAPAANTKVVGRQIAMSTLGRWLEYGTKFMAARAHFRPEIQAAEALMRGEGRKAMNKIRKKWSKLPMIRTTMRSR